MNGSIDITDAIAILTGDARSQGELAKEGARRALSQIDKLRNQLRQAERDCQNVLSAGNALHDSDKIWKRVAKAADKLLEGMVA